MSGQGKFHRLHAFDLKGKVALVTGGGTGIGLMIAQGLAANGAKVYVASRRKEVVDKVAGTSGEGSIVALQLDVTDKESIAAAVKHVEQTDGKLHILINNAGQVGPTSLFFSKKDAPEQKAIGTALFADQSFDGWANLFNANVSSIFFVTVAFLELLQKSYVAAESDGGAEAWSPSVVNITSISGVMKLAQDHFCYNASKAAGNHLTLMLSTELALKRIPVRVNAVAPGVYASEMTSRQGGNFTEEESNAICKGITPLPAARGGTDVEIASSVLYLVSPSGFYTNGQVLVVDGGFVATNP